MRYGETSLIAFLLTDQIGRQNYLIQGARGGKNRRTALFQPMMVLDFEGIASPRLQMHRMKDAAAMPLKSIPFDVRKSTIALFMAEVLYRLIKEVEPHSPLLDFVVGSVEMLDALPDEGVANFHLWFLVRLSSYLGFYPGNEPLKFFDIKEGIFVPSKPSHGICFDEADTLILSELMTTDDLSQLQLSRTSRGRFLTSMLRYFGYHLDTVGTIRSVDILREVF